MEESDYCSNCGKVFSRKEWLKVNEEKCVGEMQSKFQKEFNCQYCEKTLSSISAIRLHEKNKHLVEKYICNICPVLLKFSNKSNLKKHCNRKYSGRNYQIRSGSFVRNLSEHEVNDQPFKMVQCEVCHVEFT